MNWLFKTEPSDYSFEKLLQEKRTTWTGVKNALALQHLRKVKKNAKAVVGVARALADATDDAVLIAPLRALPPLSLPAIKADKRFKDFPLVTFGRLSVMPVPDALWPILTGSR